MFFICTVPVETVQSCKELFVLPLFNVLDVLEFYTLSLVTAALTQRVLLILPKKQPRSVPFQTYQESWRTAVIQIGQVSQTKIRFIKKYTISIKHLLFFVVNLERKTCTCNNNRNGSWELMKHSSVCDLSEPEMYRLCLLNSSTCHSNNGKFSIQQHIYLAYTWSLTKAPEVPNSSLLLGMCNDEKSECFV